jgi:hypothetical protein
VVWLTDYVHCYMKHQFFSCNDLWIAFTYHVHDFLQVSDNHTFEVCVCVSMLYIRKQLFSETISGKAGRLNFYVTNLKSIGWVREGVWKFAEIGTCAPKDSYSADANIPVPTTQNNCKAVNKICLIQDFVLFMKVKSLLYFKFALFRSTDVNDFNVSVIHVEDVRRIEDMQ